MKEFFDLLLDNGEIVRCEVPTKHSDDCFDRLEHELKRRGWWSPGSWDGCRAEYLGHTLDRVNMGRVVGVLR